MKKVIRIFFVTMVFLSHISLSAQEEYTYTNIDEEWFEGELAAVTSKLDHSTHPVDIYNLSYTEMLKGNFSRALRLAEQLETDYPDWNIFLKGNIYFMNGELDLARPLLLSHFEEYPDDFETLMTISQLYYKQKKYDDARVLLVEEVDNFPNEIIMVGIAKTYLAENKYDEALLWLDDAEKVYPSLEVLWEQIKVYYKLKNKSKLFEYGLKMTTMYSGTQYTDTLKMMLQDHGITNQLISTKPDSMIPITLNVGETIKYDVSYGFIHLGELSIEVKDELTYRGRKCFRVEYLVNTAVGLPFITLHHRYVGYLDKKTMLGYKSLAYINEDDGIKRRSYLMDYGNKKLEIYRIKPDGRIIYKKKPLPAIAVDAMSLLFYARNLVKNNMSTTVTTIIDDNYKTADIFFQNRQSEIDVLNQTVNSEEVFAQANFEGIAGMTGEVWGWFIDPYGSCVPAIGKAQIFLGKITLTLVKWRP